jgi:hypothetical protein
VQSQAIAQFTKFGFDPMSAVDAIAAGNLALLKHDGPPLEIMTEVPKASPPAAVLPGAGDTSGKVLEPARPINGATKVVNGG